AESHNLSTPIRDVGSAAMVSTHKRDVTTRGQGDAHDVTDLVSASVADSGCAAGIATVFVVGSTAAVTTIEFEPGAVADLNRLFEDVAPRGADYRHHLRWGDDKRIEPRPRCAPRPVAHRAVRRREAAARNMAAD